MGGPWGRPERSVGSGGGGVGYRGGRVWAMAERSVGKGWTLAERSVGKRGAGCGLWLRGPWARTERGVGNC